MAEVALWSDGQREEKGQQMDRFEVVGRFESQNGYSAAIFVL